MTPLKDYGPDDPNYVPGVHISGYRSGGYNAVDKVVGDVQSEMTMGMQAPAASHGNAADQVVGAVKAEQERQKQAQKALMDAANNQRR